jgi:hypothetical protein
LRETALREAQAFLLPMKFRLGGAQRAPVSNLWTTRNNGEGICIAGHKFRAGFPRLSPHCRSR